ncbi:MAG: hypothetical protein NZM40_09265 [Sphingomonadaceae bacterium]|uniref:hypothetical protein n=1 Tax=Thermaurantiacus sp. TaxID=2820283 RepID=UPI00298F0093|nr:hypothetical protein [Thermaurantiacus sp.]MCS6987596.1 hypothetical protein [Sphingomonadaceae bacterium]MDW8415197.1 hypothetical protein [Thermaurantiacus sp.]
MADLRPVRRWVSPGPGEGFADIARRALPDLPEAEAVGRLQSWNLHVFLRAPAPPGSPRAGNPVLPSDVIFVEPPLPA